MKLNLSSLLLGTITLLASAVASAATLLEFTFENAQNTGNLTYTPVTNTLTGANVPAQITRLNQGAVNYGSDSWAGGSGQTMAINPFANPRPVQFTLQFDATGFQDFGLTFNYINESSTDYSIDAVQYQVNGGGFTNISGAPLLFTGSGGGAGPGHIYSISLESLSAIENVANVEIRFLGTANIPGTVKIDNLVLSGDTYTPVPEPSSAAALAGAAMLGLAALRRRRARA